MYLFVLVGLQIVSVAGIVDSNVNLSVPCSLAGSVSGCVDDSVVGIALGSGLVVWNLAINVCGC